MKKSKILTWLVATVMVFALSVPAFAFSDSDYNTITDFSQQGPAIDDTALGGLARDAKIDWSGIQATYTYTGSPVELNAKPVVVEHYGSNGAGNRDNNTYTGDTPQLILYYDVEGNRVNNAEGEPVAPTNVGSYTAILVTYDKPDNTRLLTTKTSENPTFEFKIEPAEVTVTMPTDIVYGEKFAAPVISGGVAGETGDQLGTFFFLKKSDSSKIDAEKINPADTYTAVVKLNKNYTVADGTQGKGTAVDGATKITKTVNIKKAEIVSVNKPTELVYDGTAKLVTLTGVTVDGVAETGAAVGTVAYKDANGDDVENPTNAGTYSYTVTLADNYKDQESSVLTGTFTIAPKEVTAVLTASDKEYDANKTAEVTGVVTGVNNETFTVTGVTGEFVDVNAGTGKVVKIDVTEAVAVPDQATTLLSNYDITFPTDDLNATIKPYDIVAHNGKVKITNKLYATGFPQIRKLKVTAGDFKLASSDYTVAGNGEHTVGLHDLEVTGVGNFTGTIKTTYYINPLGELIGYNTVKATPDTGDTFSRVGYIALMAVSAMGVVAVAKKKDEE